MKIETLAFQELLSHTPDVFEGVVVLGERATQISNRRAAERVVDDEIFTEDELTYAEPEENPDYEELEKPAVLAMEDFLSSNLTWRYASNEENEEEDGATEAAS